MHMSKIIFTLENIKILQNNPNVLKVSEKTITYSDEFKRVFIEDYLKGKRPRAIFQDAGFDINIIGIKRCEQSAARWIKAYNKDGIIALRDTRKESSGRPRISELSQEEVIQRQEARIKLLEQQVNLLKKADMIERRLVNNSINLSANEIFALIQDTISKYNLTNIVSYFCDLLNVSRSGYYHYLKSVTRRNEWEAEDLKARELILNAFNAHGYKKGSRSIKMTLANEFNVVFSRKKIQRIMRKYNIVCLIRKANPYRRMAKATKEHRVVANLLNREFKQEIPGKVLLTDITYLPYQASNMAYLSTIKDSSTNEILAYHLSKRITLDIATETIEKLMQNNQNLIAKNAFIHSDQGCHYTSPKYQKLLEEYGLGQSMSRRGNCWDNAPQESFFGHMKDEIDYRNCASFEELQKMIDDYIHYYNDYRCQWNLKQLTPVQYRNQLLAA